MLFRSIGYIKKMIETEGFKKEYKKIRKELKGIKVIGSVERLSPVSGIREKFAAYNKYLHMYSDSMTDGKLVQVDYSLH